MTIICCDECGKKEEVDGVHLKACKSCMLVKYCNADCQRNNWPKHKKACKERATEIRDEALFRDPPDKEDCPICFLPMPVRLICCAMHPPASETVVPIADFAEANEELTDISTEEYYSCCGKSICKGCLHTLEESGNDERCPFCNSDRCNKTAEEIVEEFNSRVASNDAGAMYVLGHHYYQGRAGLQHDRERAIELWTQAADLGSSKAHFNLGILYHEGGDSKKKKFHWEAAAMAGHEVARFNLGTMENDSGNMERAFKHWTIAASAGEYCAMNNLRSLFNPRLISRQLIKSTLIAYNKSCVEMRSEQRDAVLML